MVIRHPSNPTTLTRLAAIAAGLCALAAGCGYACPLYPDWLTLKTGEKLQGEIVQADRFHVDFRMLESGKWVTKTFSETEIIRRERVDGDQSDGAPNPGTKQPGARASDPTLAPGSEKSRDGSKTTTSGVLTPREPVTLESPKDLIPLLRSTLPSTEEFGELVVVKLDGEFKADNLFGIGSTITPGAFNALITVAEERHPSAIVLAINSGGGYDWVMKLLIEQLLELQRNRDVRVVAWPATAGSAAAIMTLACKEIVVTPTTRMGAAIAIDRGGEAIPAPQNALEQKLQAWDDSLLQLVIEFTGRSPTVQRAMEEAKLEVWFHPQRCVFADKKPPDFKEWVSLDERPDLPLVLTGDQLRLIKFALPVTATNNQELVKALGLPTGTPVRTLDLNNAVIQEAVKPLRANAIKEFGEFLKTWKKLWDGLATARNELSSAQHCWLAIPKQGIRAGHLIGLKQIVQKAKDAIPTMLRRDRELMQIYAGLAWLQRFDFWATEYRKVCQQVLDNLGELIRNKSGTVTEYWQLRSASDCVHRAFGIDVQEEDAGKK